MTAKPKTKRVARPVDARRVVIYDLTDEERAWVRAQAEADDRSISVWLARLVRERMAREGQPASGKVS